jgi:hypothetical protein
MSAHGGGCRRSGRCAAFSLAMTLSVACGDDEAASSSAAAAGSGTQGTSSQGSGVAGTASQGAGAGGSNGDGGGSAASVSTSTTSATASSGQSGGGGSDAITTGTGGADSGDAGGGGTGGGGASCPGGPGPIDEVVGVWIAAEGEKDYLALDQSEGCASGTTCEDEDGTGECHDLQELTLVDGRLTYFYTFRRGAEVEVVTADLMLVDGGATLDGTLHSTKCDCFTPYVYARQ